MHTIRMRIVFPFIFILLLSVISCSTTQNEPIALGPEAQLFVDDFLIDSQENLKRTLNQPKKDNDGNMPVISLEDEFGDAGSTLEANGTIVYDPRLGKYVMFALGYGSGWRAVIPKKWDIVRIYRFTSKDGIHWMKGDDGTPQRVFPKSPEFLKDRVSGASATNLDLFSCFYDTDDADYPYKGWLYFQNWGDDREGIYYVESRDGISWERGPQVAVGFGDHGYRTIHQDGRTLVGPADVSIFYHDKIDNRFLGIFKFYSPEAVEHGNKLRSRAYAFLPRPLKAPFDIKQLTHIELLPPAADKNNDQPHDEYYGSTGWRYESLWLGGLKIWHGGGDYPWSAAGCAFLKLISSRDGLDWSKVPFKNSDGYPEVFIANGPEGGNNGRNDGGYMTEFSQEPLRIGDELILYYGSSSYGKNNPDHVRVSGGGIFRARMRVEGFVSVDGGRLTTKLFSFSGDDLTVNAIGPVTIEALSASGTVLGSQTIKGDSMGHLVTFNGKNLGETVGGNKARLRFGVGDTGKLYSFRICSSENNN
jgi:hypothetical protein